MFDYWNWKWVLGRAWAIAIDISVIFLGIGAGFVAWVLLSNLAARHLADATANNVVQVITSYVQWVNGYVGSVSAIIGLACLAFIVISRLIVHYMSQRY